jgi:pullulanase
MTSFGVDGLRLDSINNIANYDFIRSYKEYAWSVYNSRYPSAQAWESYAKLRNVT